MGEKYATGLEIKRCVGMAKWRVGMANVGTMVGRSEEICDMAGRRNLDVCCLQETRWKDGNAKMIGREGARFKFFWVGSKVGQAGVGILVAEKWVDKVVEVVRVCERILVLRLMVGHNVVNIVSVYALQVGRSKEDKEDFYGLLGKVLLGIKDSEGLLVCGDFNGHVGAAVDGFAGVHGGNGYGNRNAEGEQLLEFADAMGLAVANTYFVKRDSQKVTYESGGCKTMVDYVLVRANERKVVRDVKVIGSEACLPQHKLLVCVLAYQDGVIVRKEFVSRCRTWRLKDGNVQEKFKARVQVLSAGRKDGDVDVVWNGLRDCLVGAAEEVCGRTKCCAKKRETWWWNSEVGDAIKLKRELFVAFQKAKKSMSPIATELSKVAYDKAKRLAKQAIAKAKESERKRLGEMLVREDGKGRIFRIAKQMVKENQDVTGSGYVKDPDGKIVAEDERIRDVWRAYYDKLLNEEFRWDRNSLGMVEGIAGVEELISAEEVKEALHKSKSGKAAGPTGVVVEMIKAAGDLGVAWVTDVCNGIIKEGKIPDDWKMSWIVNV